jgi:hypothetical protein
MIEINALNVLSSRKIDEVAPHYAKMKIADNDWYGTDIENWIQNKLKGRFFLVKYPAINNEGKMKNCTFVGFEDHKELTYFMLACPHLRR